MSTKSTQSDSAGASPTSSVKKVSLPSSKTSSHSGSWRSTASEGHDSEGGLSAGESKHKYTFLPEPPREKLSLKEIHRRQLRDKPLFADVLILDDGTDGVQQGKTSIDESILVTGFGIRNLESLQNALQEEEEKRLQELYKYQAEEGRTSEGSSTSKSITKSTSKSIETETEIRSVKSDASIQRQKLEYLMGLDANAEEEGMTGKYPEGEEEEDQFIFSASVSMKTAQKYLRTHRIFDFFQFIIAHLLSALPENPIEFILLLLSNCLMYRSGLGKAPLLYEEKHIRELYGLMDRMKTGFIELDQYKKGMITLGICDFTKNPPLSQDRMVEKEYFIQEALENETAQFEDLIKRKWIGVKPVSEPNYSNAGSSCHSVIGPYFIPSDLLKSYKRKDSASKIEEEGSERRGSIK